MFKKIILFFVLLGCASLAFSQQYPPKSNTLVTDYTGTLADADKQQLESKLVAFDDTSSTQIAIVMIKSVGDNDIDQYAVGLGRNWGIGQKDKNNGLLILVAVDDHKVSMQIGYGLEGAVPDAITSQIIHNDMIPHFKQNDYFGGLNIATDHLIQFTKGEYKADKQPANNDDQSSGGGILIVIIIVVVILVFIFRNRGGGGGRRIISGRGGASPFWWFLAGDMLGSSGRGGGGWGGGGSSGGGGGGGGFGGFGGGSFGGGGSSGSW